jgi:hypothetical protein
VWLVVVGVVFCVGFELVFCFFGFLTMFDLVISRMSDPHAHTESWGRVIGLDAVGKLLLWWWGCFDVCLGVGDEDVVDLIVLFFLCCVFGFALVLNWC